MAGMIDLVARGEIDARLERPLRAPRRPARAERLRRPVPLRCVNSSFAPTEMIPPDTAIGRVRLRVADIDDLATFYERVIGLRAVERDGDVARLGPDGGEPADRAGLRAGRALRAELQHGPVPPRDPGAGPRRAGTLTRRAASAGWRLTGASDHLVSEALYLRDPEGNGIEIYRDRPRDQWGHDGGELRMATLPLDLAGRPGRAGRPPRGPRTGCRRTRRWATCTSRWRTSRRPRASTTAGSDWT